MTAITFKTNGQRLIIHSSSATLYTEAAASNAVTLPKVIETDVTYYTAPDTFKTAVVVKQPDGTTIYSQTIGSGAWQSAATVEPLPTALQVASDVAAPFGAALRRASTLCETFPRSLGALTNSAALTSGRLYLVAVDLPKVTVVTSITFMSGTTALSAGTNQWFALYDKDLALLGQTADDTSTAWGTSAEKTLALTSPYTTTYAGLHYLGIMVAASTPPSLWCVVSNSNVTGLAPKLAGNSTTSLTTTAPATAAAITAASSVPYAVAA